MRRVVTVYGFVVMAVGIGLTAGCSNGSETTAPPSEQPATETPAGVGRVNGRVSLTSSRVAFVLLEPADDPGAMTATESPRVMDQVNMAFVPDSLVARPGAPVTFRSSDDALHNVNVMQASTRKQEFNVAIVPEGTYEYTFTAPGVYDIRCDVHPTMEAQILVARSPYVTTTTVDGSFQFENIPTGSYTLIVHVGAKRTERPFRVEPGVNQVRVD